MPDARAERDTRDGQPANGQADGESQNTAACRAACLQKLTFVRMNEFRRAGGVCEPPPDKHLAKVSGTSKQYA
ncbi:MAG: hypothetical protein GY878_28345 [Fuerstiella sp.]|nr:hypothetical protein [Fuerstiella sp.]